MKNLFLREDSFYQRTLDPINQYVEQSAFYLSKTKGRPIEEFRGAIKEKLKARAFPEMKDPVVRFYERHNCEDREITLVPLSQFLSSISKENLTMAPSLTCYVNAGERQSLLSGFTDDNVKLRKAAKKLAEKYKALDDMDKFRHYNGEQENKKLYNNSLSGAFSSGGSIVRNPTAHSSLTSTTRTMTSIGNASNERLISGNRHYRNATITLNNLVVLASTANKEEIDEALSKFNIKVPTVNDVMQCIEHSTQLYWHDRAQTAKILQFVMTLSDIERAAIVYTGDFYHLRKFNEEVIRNFVGQVSRKVTGVEVKDPIEVIHKTDEMYVNYVHQICLTEVKGIGKDYTILSPESLNTVAATCINLQGVLEEHHGLIKAFFLTSNLPPSVAYIRESVRRSVVLSDTDSTMFSCDEWVYWYFNELKFDDEAYSVAGAVMFMATQCIAHSLAVYSAQLNVERKKLFMAAMKPEFCFPIFALTSVGKHYYTYVSVKEGSVYKKLESEIKGVWLKNSAAPKPIITDVKKMMETILDTVMKGSKISLTYWIKHVADLEREIKRSVMAGESTYLGRLNIKDAAAYKGTPEESNYRHHLFWNEVFGPKYGMAPQPTYTTVKFPTTISSKRVIQLWLAQIEDEGIKSRLTEYFVRTARKDMNTVYIGQNLIEGFGVPKEIAAIIDVENLVYQHLVSHRLVLESIGFFQKDNLNLTQQGY